MKTLLLPIILMIVPSDAIAQNTASVIVTAEIWEVQKKENSIVEAIAGASLALYNVRQEGCGYAERDLDYARLNARFRELWTKVDVVVMYHPHRDRPACSEDDLSYRKHLNTTHRQLTTLLQLLKKKAQ